jgi:phosphatidylglycerol lysyltransferase
LHGDVSRFMRASLVVSLLLAGVAFNSILTGRRSPTRPQPIPDVVRTLVSASEDTEANLALTGDKAFLIAPDGTAFLAYGDTGRSLISKGEPIGDPETGRDLIWQLREKADREGKRCAFYAVGPHFLPTYLDLGLTILKIGEVARVDLRGFTLEGSQKKDFRQARNRAARDGYRFEIIPRADLAPACPSSRPSRTHGLPPSRARKRAFRSARSNPVICRISTTRLCAIRRATSWPSPTSFKGRTGMNCRST